VAAGRPYPDLDSVLAASDDAFVRMSSPDLSAAVAAHPRIGEPTEQGKWSRQEQAGAAGADPDVLAELAAGNREYERRFGQVFLICATGLSAADMRAALRARLGNDPATEEKIVAEELRKIAGLRLRKLLGGAGK
jgi:2-oxo-4-hydroxy-4-carboxy-5-ureidoimidazoline decarboxylase